MTLRCNKVSLMALLVCALRLARTFDTSAMATLSAHATAYEVDGIKSIIWRFPTMDDGDWL